MDFAGNYNEMTDDLDTGKGPWTPEEDTVLRNLVNVNGPRNWTKIAECIPGRTGKSCRLRWLNQLNPNVRGGPFTQEEDTLILWAHLQYGNKWASIAKHLPGRTDNHIKNRWNCTLKKRYGHQLDQLRAEVGPMITFNDIVALVERNGPGGSSNGSSASRGLPAASGLAALAGVSGAAQRWPQGNGSSAVGFAAAAAPLGPAGMPLLGPPPGLQGLPLGPGAAQLGANAMAGLPLALGMAGGLAMGPAAAAAAAGLSSSPLQQQMRLALGGPAAGAVTGELSPRSKAILAAAADQDRLARGGPGVGGAAGSAFSLYGAAGGGAGPEQQQEEGRGTKRPWAAAGASSEEHGSDEGEDSAALALRQLAHHPLRLANGRAEAAGADDGDAGDDSEDYEEGSDEDYEEGDEDTESRRRRGRGAGGLGPRKGARGAGGGGAGRGRSGRGRPSGVPQTLEAPGLWVPGPAPAAGRPAVSAAPAAAADQRGGAEEQEAHPSLPPQQQAPPPPLLALMPPPPLKLDSSTARSGDCPRKSDGSAGEGEAEPGATATAVQPAPAASVSADDAAAAAAVNAAAVAAAAAGPGGAVVAAQGAGGYGAMLLGLPENLLQLSSSLRVVLTTGNIPAAQALVSRLEEIAYSVLMHRAAFSLANVSDPSVGELQQQQQRQQAQAQQQQAAAAAQAQHQQILQLQQQQQAQQVQQQAQQQQQQQAAALNGLVGAGAGGGVDAQVLAQLLLLTQGGALG